MRDIKVITNSLEPKTISELYNKTKGNTNIIPLTISTILLKYSKEYSNKNPDIIIFLQDNNLYKDLN